MPKPKPETQPADTTPIAETAERDAPAAAPPKGKLGLLVRLLQRPEGAGINEMSEVTGWLPHSVRGAIAGALKKQRGYQISSEAAEGGRVYRILTAAAE